VTDVDYLNKTATVFWEPSIYSGDYGIVFVVGTPGTLTSVRSSISWVTDLGPEPEFEVLFTYSGVIAPNFVFGSVVQHQFTLAETTNVRIEVTSSSFDSHLYLFQSFFLDAPSYIADDSDASSLLSIIDLAISAGNYLVSIGNSPLSQNDAKSIINSSEGGSSIGDGAYEIKVFKLPAEDNGGGGIIPGGGGIIPGGEEFILQ